MPPSVSQVCENAFFNKSHWVFPYQVIGYSLKENLQEHSSCTTSEYQLVADQRLAEFEKKMNSAETGLSIPIHHKTQNTATDSSPEIQSSRTTLIEYFKENGFKVIDYRLGGCALWVIRSEAVLTPYVNYAEKHFGVTDRYGSGRATNSKPAWRTKDKQ